MTRRIIALFLALVMTAGMLPTFVLAEELPETETEEWTAETTEVTEAAEVTQTTEETEAAEAAVTVEAPDGAAEEEEAGETEENTVVLTSDELSGSCGDSASWSYDEASRTLTITGSGAMTTYSTSSPAPWAGYAGETKTLTISGISSIGNYAFYGFTALTEVAMPAAVTVGTNAFYNCSAISHVTLTGSGAMKSCDSTSCAYMPWRASSVGVTVTVEEGITSIGSYAFYNCTALTAVELPETLKNIYSCAFYGCTSLKEISLPESVTGISSAAFCGCTDLTRINIPGTVLTLSGNTFESCTSLEEVTFHEGTTNLGSYTFRGCTSLKTVTIPSTVTQIGSEEFYGCSSLTGVTIPENVASIGYGAFRGCSSLKNITIPETVTFLGTYAFAECTALTSLIIPESVTAINADLFYGCTSLTSVTIPAGVTTIDNAAFYGCSALTEITIPETVTSIGSNAFYGCSALTEITIPETVTSIGSSAFYYCTGLASINIPGSVKTIGSNAFNNCTGLTSVTIPAGVTSIGEGAFAWCTSLKSVSIPDGVTAIGSYAFSYCTSLTSVKFPAGITSIEACTFNECTSLTGVNIPAGVTSIGSAAFYNCDSLTSVVIPDGVTEIRADAFESCGSLASVTIPSSVTDIGSRAFGSNPVLTQIHFKHTSSDTLYIDYNAFYLSTNSNYADVKTTVSVPYSRDIHSAVSGYEWDSYGREVSYVSNEILPAGTISIAAQDDLAEIEAGLELQFIVALDPWYCTSEIEWSVIPGTGSAAIDENGVLVGIEPGVVTVRAQSGDDDSVYDETQITILKASAYVSAITVRCQGQAEDEAEVGTSVQMIADIQPGNAANRGVTWEVENGTGSAAITEDGVLTALTTGTVTVYATAVDGTEIIGSRTVNIVRYVDEIAILINGRSDVAEIGVGETMAISVQVNPVDATNSSVSWSVENGTGSATLSYSNSEVYFNGGEAGTVTLVATAADSQHLTVSKELTVVGEKAAYAVTGGNIYYNSATGAITGCDDTVTNANIPGIINGVRITSIAPKAFYNRDSLTSVTIPSAVTRVGERAFSNCDSLTSMKISGTGLTTIADYAFYDCDALTAVNLPASVTTIGKYAFAYCGNVTTLIIPEGVVSVGQNAFGGLSGLKYLTLPGTLNTRDILSYNDKLETVTFTGSTIISMPVEQNDGWYSVDHLPGRSAKKIIIRDSVTAIGDYAFYDCDGITEVTIGEGVTAIGNYAFNGCGSMTTLTMGSSVTSIGNYAFAECSKLTQITLSEGIQTLGEGAFRWCNSLTSLNLPDSIQSIGRYCFECNESSPLQIIDLSANPTEMKVPELQLVRSVPSVLVSATGGRNSLYWSMIYTEEDYLAGKPYPYEIAGLDDNGRMYAYSSGTVTIICRDEYTGAKGTWTISVESGVVIQAAGDATCITSGNTLQLTAYQMPSGEKASVSWSLRSSDQSYASIDSNGKVTAKTVTSPYQVEITAYPTNGSEAVTIKLWILPKATSLILYEGDSMAPVGESGTTVQTIRVDMAQTPTVQLTAAMEPEGALDSVSWKSGSTSIATVDKNGLVTLLKPGTVTITATADDGSKKSASVKLEITYLDDAKTLTAAVEVPSIGLQEGQKTTMLVYGSDKKTPLDAGDLEFSISASQQSIATVDENGVITAGEKTGTVTVTAAIAGDPLNRRVSVKVKVIARQTDTLVLRPSAEAPAEVVMYDADGAVTSDASEAVRYAVYLNKAHISGGYSFHIKPAAADSEGTELTLTKSSLKWASTDTKLATVTANTDGTASVTIKANADGACTITAVTTDLAKLESQLSIVVRDYAPRLGSTALTLNTKADTGVSTNFVESYGNTVESISVYEYDSSAKAYSGTESTRLYAAYTSGVLTITSSQTIKDGTVKLLLAADCANGETYEYEIKLTVKNTVPAITVKQSGKFNLFYTDSTAAFTVTAKNAEVTDVELMDTADFTVEYDAEKGGVIRFSDSYIEDCSGKPDAKGTLLVYVEGYSEPVSKSISITTATSKPSLSLTPASSIVNTALSQVPLTSFGVYNKTAGETLELTESQVEVTASFADAYVSEGKVMLYLTGTAGGTATVQVRMDNWTQSIKLTHKVTVKKDLPVAKLSASTLKLNRVFSAQTASAAVTLNHSNLDLGNVEIISTAKAGSTARAEAEKLTVAYDPETGAILASITDPEDAPKAGTYAYSCVPYLTDGTKLKAVTLKVSVSATVPKVSFTSATLKLNNVLYGYESVSTGIKAISGYELAGFVELDNWDDKTVNLVFVEGELIANLNDENATAKTYTFKLTPILRDLATGQEAALTSKVSLNVQVYSNSKLSVTLSTKGKLDVIVPDSAITYTVSKINNAAGNIDGVTLVGADAGKFHAELDTTGAKPTVTLTMLEGETYATNVTYKVQFAFDICGREVLSSLLSVKMTQSKLSLSTSPASVTLYQAQTAPMTCTVNLTSPAGALLADVELDTAKTSAAFLDAMGDGGMTVTIREDGTAAELSFDVRNPEVLTSGKSYVLYLNVTPEGCAENGNATQLKLTVKVVK